MGRLFWKIFFGLWLTLLLVGSAVGTLVWLHNRERIAELEMLVDTPRAEMGLARVAEILNRDGETALQELMERRRGMHRRALPMLIVDDQGKDLLGRPVPHLPLMKARQQLAEPGQSVVQETTAPDGRHYLLFIPRRDLQAMPTTLLGPYRPLLPLLIPIIASVIFSVGLAWYLTRPIRSLRDASNRLAAGQLDTRVMPAIGSRRDELADLGNDFDHMAEQIEQLIAAQKQLLNDVSHELRSPLARLGIAVELSRQQPQRAPELLERIEKEIGRLDELVGELLTLSRLEAGVFEGELDWLDLDGLVETVAEDARFEAQRLNCAVRYQGIDEGLIQGRVELLRRAIENVVRNGLTHSPAGSELTISLSQEAGRFVVIVCDQGPGVPEEKLGQLFRPFVRIEETNHNTALPGYGLGLAIAKRATEIHRGTIRARNRETGGLCIEISLPDVTDAQQAVEIRSGEWETRQK